MFCRAGIGATLLAALCATIVGAQAHDELKYPDWAGKWARVEGGPPRYDPSKARGRAQEPPLTPEFQAIFEKSFCGAGCGWPGQ